MADVYLNGALIGEVDDPQAFVSGLKEARRSGKISALMNVMHNHKQNAVVLMTERNRVRRPLIVVKEGKSMLTQAHIEKLKAGQLKWSDLVREGVIEYLDAAEEESTYIAVR